MAESQLAIKYELLEFLGDSWELGGDCQRGPSTSGQLFRVHLHVCTSTGTFARPHVCRVMQSQRKVIFQCFFADCRAAGEGKMRRWQQRREGTKEGREVRESVAFRVGNRGVWAGASGRVCVHRRRSLAEIWFGALPSGGRHEQLRYTDTHAHTHAGYQLKKYLIIMVPADTSHAHTHACRQTQLPVTMCMFPQLWQTAMLRNLSYQNFPARLFREHKTAFGIFSAYHLCNCSTDLSAALDPQKRTGGGAGHLKATAWRTTPKLLLKKTPHI